MNSFDTSTFDTNTNCNNVISNYNNYNNYNTTTSYSFDDDAQVMEWLSPLDLENRHRDAVTDRVDGIGNWLLETAEFQEWRGGEGGADKAVLYCSGNPGAGKTYLSSLVINSLCDQAWEGNIAVACWYCDFRAQQEQTTPNMIGEILKQLVGRTRIPNDIREAYRKWRRPRLRDLMRMLKIVIAALPKVFICIDGLDECLRKDLFELLESLRDIVRETPRTRVFLTGRPYVEGDIQRHFTNVVMIRISPNPDDIRNYLQMRLDRDDELDAMDNDLRADIIKVIMDKFSSIFLLVSLNIEAILGEVTIGQRRKKLEELARDNGLSDAYTTSLTRLKAQKRNRAELGLKALMWVLHSERPLRPEELGGALGVEIGSPDLDLACVPALQTLLSSCLGLVTVERSSSTLRLVHYTLQEHLLSDPTLFHSPHSTIAEVCLTYLNCTSVRDLSPILRSAPPTMPLLEYASFYWGEHTRRGMTENVKALALRLLDRFDEHISAHLLLLRYSCDIYLGQYSIARGPKGFTGLQGVVFLGIVEFVAPMLEIEKCDVNVANNTWNTALAWAAQTGQEGVVKLLLERKDVNPNQGDTKYGRTPLWLAARNGHEGIVKMLLERINVRPTIPDNENQSPLSIALSARHYGVARILEEWVNVSSDRTNHGR